MRAKRRLRFFLDYWPILPHDATMQAGPPLLQGATVRNVENYFGWTLTTFESLQIVNQQMLRGSCV